MSDTRPVAVDLDFQAARRALSGIARRTPIVEAPELSERVGREVLLKAECLQVTGSFKVRGAAARLAALTSSERERGVVACSSGNHGRAVAYVAARLGISAVVCLPRWADSVKVDGIRQAGAEALVAGDSYDEAEAIALALAEEQGRTFVSAFDDPWVVAGQGTLALELLEQGVRPGAVIVPLSGGGLAAGIAAALRWKLGGDAPPTVAVSAARAAVMLASLAAGAPVELPEEETLASALSGGIGPDNRHSFRWVRDLVAAHVTVTEAEIARGMLHAARHARLIVEGGGAVGLAALLSERPNAARVARGAPDGPLVVVLSGGNVAPSALAGALRRALAEGSAPT